MWKKRNEHIFTNNLFNNRRNFHICVPTCFSSIISDDGRDWNVQSLHNGRVLMTTARNAFAEIAAEMYNDPTWALGKHYGTQQKMMEHRIMFMLVAADIKGIPPVITITKLLIAFAFGVQVQVPPWLLLSMLIVQLLLKGLLLSKTSLLPSLQLATLGFVINNLSNLNCPSPVFPPHTQHIELQNCNIILFKPP